MEKAEDKAIMKAIHIIQERAVKVVMHTEIIREEVLQLLIVLLLEQEVILVVRAVIKATTMAAVVVERLSLFRLFGLKIKI